MVNAFVNSPSFGLIIILVALVLAAIVTSISNSRREAKRRAAELAPVSRPGLQRGVMRLQQGDNWQAVCPDCGAFNVFYRRTGLECRHCQSELAIVGGWQGGTSDPDGVFSRTTQNRNDRVMWVATNNPRMDGVPVWSNRVFQDIPESALRPLNPETDMDWRELRDYMPVLCPSCQAAPLADCPDCLRTGFRTVPLAEWSKPDQKRLSSAAIRQLRDTYSMRCGGLDNAREAHTMLYMQASRGLGPLVLSGARQRIDPAILKEATGETVQPAMSKPTPPINRTRRDGELPDADPVNERGFHVGGYQPHPDPEGRDPRLPPRKP
ncbi:hypothetical protein phiA034_gene0046 [Aeromonas phage phiA034]|uniref:Uncharacterized protein n=1 Tax=Aeromonas phage phiA034 TaxID=2985287 RepID=A0AAF0BZ97_9CAUD|nr:hypothetical protein phiA034_gene0046 [Aeromonas phage phiA034]